MARIAFVQNDYEQAREYCEESLRLFEESDIPIQIPKVMTLLALLSILLGEETKAITLLNKAYSRSEEINDEGDMAAVLYSQGFLALSQKEYSRACDLFKESMKILLPANGQRSGLNDWVLPATLEGIGTVAFEQGNFTRCISYFALADVTRQSCPFDKFLKPCHVRYQHLMEEIKDTPGQNRFTHAWNAGQAMTQHHALDLLALDIEDPSSSSPVKVSPITPLPKSLIVEKEGLSQREVEVLHLIAKGLTNNQIADQLFLSPHTVNRHTQSIYRKLDINTRSAATRYAFEHHFL